MAERQAGLDGVVLCSGGLYIAQRGYELPRGGPGLRVRDVAAVSLPDSAAVEARTTDGAVWRRHWLEHDRLVIDFIGIASVDVSEDTGDIVFDRLLMEDMEQHLLFDHILPLVLARRGRLVLHGALVSRNGDGAVLAGVGGVGKSTLTAFAWSRGWTVGGDDGAVVTVGTPPTAEPTYPTIRLAPASAHLLGLETEGTSPVAGKLRLAAEDRRPFLRDGVTLRLIAILEPAAAAEDAHFEPLDGVSAHARLFGSTFHAELAGGRLLPAIIEQLARLVETTTVGRLRVPRGIDGLEAAERVLRDRIEA